MNYEPPRYDYTSDGIPIVRATREPCIVCGHPTGDCAGPSGPPHHILGFGDMRQSNSAATVPAPEDIFEEVQLTERMKTRRLVARKGQFVSIEVAKKYGLIV